MAKINEDVIIIKVSELLRDKEQIREIFDKDVIISLEQVIKELVGEDKLIEITKE